MGERLNIQVDPQNVIWGDKGHWTVDTIADSSGNLNSQYFLLDAADGSLYYVWYNINSAGVDPAIAGRTGIPVAGATNASAATLATATATAIDANSDFLSWVDSSDDNKVHIQAADVGEADAPVDGAATTGFAFATVLAGSGFDLGFIDGDIELGIGPEEAVDVKAHQTGSNVIERITTGRVIEDISFSMKESELEKMQAMLDVAGGNYTPGGGSKVYGLGMAKDFTSHSSRSKMLVLHPKKLASSSRSRDVMFWYAYPQIESIAFSGEKERLHNVTFKVLPNFDVDEDLAYCVFGDHAQRFD